MTECGRVYLGVGGVTGNGRLGGRQDVGMRQGVV